MNARVDLPPGREVCPTTTRRLIGEGALLVDVRERAEIDRLAFDVPDIVALPMSELEQRFAELPRERELVMVCQTGARSLKATYFLMYQGYTRVANMEGGIDKWVRKGFPVKGDASQAAAPVTGGSCCGGAPAAATSAACCTPSASSGACC
jgi:rhodanese-related sulfurtransferase